jgi:hypothetical protein
MKNLFKTTIAGAALLATTTFAQADPVSVDSMNLYTTNLEPGYSDSIDMASIPALDETVEMTPEFERPNNFMSDAGVYRYAYFEKTGTWLTLGEAEAALRGNTPMENI